MLEKDQSPTYLRTDIGIRIAADLLSNLFFKILSNQILVDLLVMRKCRNNLNKALLFMIEYLSSIPPFIPTTVR